MRLFLLALAAGAGLAAAPHAHAQTAEIGAATMRESPGLARHFERVGTHGSFVLYDTATKELVVHDRERAGRGFLPASTFKIAAALIALDTGVVSDADRDVLEWNGEDWIVPACNADQSLRTALQRSCVPIFAELVREIGDERLRAGLEAFRYGNAEPSGGYPYWLQGDLRISAFEQIAFLDRLRRDALPLPDRVMETVRDIAVLETTNEYVMRGKTGWADSPEPDIGWVVGWVETERGDHVFALNLDIHGMETVEQRLPLLKALLTELGVVAAM